MKVDFKKFMFWKDPDFQRFYFWKLRKCKHCGYPLSEKYMYETTASGNKKRVYCCNICYVLKERQ